MRNPRNLANRFGNGRHKTREIYGETQIPETQEISKIGEDLHQESVQHREIKRRGNNRPWLSKEERTRIYAEATPAPFDEHKVGQKEIARRFGVAVSTVSDIVNNKRRIDNSPRAVDQSTIQAAQAKVDEALDRVREQAIDRLMAGLGQLTDDKISAHNAKDISTVCSNMARVVQQTIPQEKGAQAINLIVYTPELRNEASFDVIEVGD